MLPLRAISRDSIIYSRRKRKDKESRGVKEADKKIEEGR